VKKIFFKEGVSQEGKPDSVIDICERVSKISIYALVFLMPLVFLPWTANVLEFNKQALLVILTFVSFFAWLLKVLVSGKAKINISLAYAPMLLMTAVYLLSVIFSSWRYGSFWGWPQITSESLVTLVGFLLEYFLIINIFNKKEILKLAMALVFSGMAAVMYGVLQLLGFFALPVGFTRSLTFNTIGGVVNLGMFASAMLPLTMMLLISSQKKWLKIVFAAGILLEGLAVLVVNASVVWWLVLGGSALIFTFAMQRRDLFDGRWLIVPMFFLASALLFGFFKFSIPGIPERTAEFFLNQKTSLQLVLKSLQTSPVFGTGPGTFNNVFLKYRDASFNQGGFWNLNFDWASSKFLTVLSTVGVLGGIAFIALIGFFIYFSFIFIFKKGHSENQEKDAWNYGIGLLASFLVLSAGFFFSGSNMALDFTYFTVMALFAGLLYSTKKEFVLKSSSIATLVFTFSITIIFVFGLGIMILEGQRYVSAAAYLDGAKNWQAGKIQPALKRLDQAAVISPAVDLYWRDIAQAYIQNLNLISQDPNVSKDDKAKLAQISINKAVNAAKSATDNNPKSAANWDLRGSVYQSLIGIVQGTKDWAVDAFKEASKLDPSNPSYPLQSGISILKEIGSLSKEREDEKEGLFEEAKMYFAGALDLKSDYAPAHFQMARLYLAQNKQNEAISYLEKAKQAAPRDAGLAFQLGSVYYQNKNYSKAADEFERAVLQSPNYSNALYFLGLCYDQLGEKDGAIVVFQKVLQLNPGNSIVVSILNNLKAGKKALAGISGGEETGSEINQ